MKQVTHAPGTFCWVELTTTNGVGATKFYSELMGWQADDDPIPGGGTYTMLRHDGGTVGALYQMGDEMKKQGTPPSWLSFVTVESASETAKKAKELGGTAIKDAFDVMEIGSMAVLADPAGAVFAVWEPKTHHGTDHVGGKPFTMVWNELATRDADSAAKFYTKLFPWTENKQQMGATEYTVFKTGDAQSGGMLQMDEKWGETPPHWLVYFGVDDCEGKISKAKELGGSILVPATDIPPVGRFAVLKDPQGAAFSIIKLSS